MKILSIYPNHNSTICLLDNGNVILNWEQERHTRIRHDYGFDDQFVLSCLELAEWDIDDLDILCINHDKNLAPRIEGTRNGPPIAVPDTKSHFIRKFWTELFGHRLEAFAINHHVAHAASAYYTSPFEKCVIMTFDGGGDGANLSFSIGNNGKIDNFISREVPYLALWWDGISVGNFRCKPFHEMDPGSAAGKIMALAAYGEVEESLRFALVNEMDEQQVKQHPIFQDQGIYVFNNFKDFSSTESPESQNLAKCLQDITEVELGNYFRAAYKHGNGVDNLCYAGGVALNCVATSVAARKSSFRSIHVPPCPHDGGLALGMAQFVYYDVLDQPWKPKFFSPYTGPEWPIDQVTKVTRIAHSAGYDVQKVRSNDVGDLLAKGTILGICRGKSECGPRALGHRSIICRPDLPGIRDRLNFIKNREWYRPFAPIILEEFAHELLEDSQFFSPYMSLAGTISNDWLERLEGVRHIDDSTRPQVLSKLADHFLYEAIERLFEITGIPAVLNTSFNCQEPIVETPKNAYETFLSIELDALLLDDFLISRRI